MEPVSTVAVASTASAASASTSTVATGVGTGATATTASTGGAVSAEASKQAEIIRRLASTLIHSGETQILNQSEIVDEFAAPIYAGISAATPSAGGGKENSQPKSLATTNGGEKIEEMPVADGKNTDVASAKGADSSIVQPEHSPEIKVLLDENYPAPTIEQQLQTDATQIVIERNIIDEKVVQNGENKTAICLIEERVIDRKYLDYGHLSDVMSEIRHGNIPTIRQIYLAIIDLADLATFKVFRPALLKYKLEDAKVQLRQLSADLEKKSLKSDLPQTSSERYDLGRNVENRSWFKTDLVTEKHGHKDVSVERQMDLIAVNVKDVCTTTMSRNELDQLLSKRNEMLNVLQQDDAVIRIENSFSPEQIASINKKAMVWTQERVLTTTKEYTTEEHFHRYGTDLGGFLGKKISTSDADISVTERRSFSEYLSPSDNINLENINTFDDALTKFAALQKTNSMQADSALIAKYVEPSAGTRFDEGWITYIPGGSIVNLGAKADLGAKLTGWDFFWAGVDVATIALAVVTLGSSSAATAAGKSATAAGIKTVAKGGAKTVAKSIAKQGVKKGASVAGKTIAKGGAKQAGKVTLTNVGKKAGAKTAAKTATNVATKTGFKANTTYIRNGFTYITDKQGRVVKATGKLKNVPGIRSPKNQKLAAQMGKLGDEGGHLIPANYGGPGSLLNHVPQSRNVNRSVIKRIENEMGRALKQGKKVEYTVMPHYPNPTTLRPDKFTIRYTIDGVQKIRRVTNV